MDHLSYSSVSTFAYCPRMWWLNYVRGVRTPSSPAQMYGTAVHTIIEGMMVGKPVDAVTAVKMAAAKNGVRGTSLKGFDIQATADDIMSIMEDPGVASVLAGIRVDPGNVEVLIEFEVPGVPHKVIGYIDAIQTDGVPLDIKTSAWDWDDDRAKNETQPMFYLRALNTGNEKFDHLVFVKNSLVPRAYVIRTEYPGFLERVDAMVLEAWEGMSRWMDPTIGPPVCGNEKCQCRKIWV